MARNANRNGRASKQSRQRLGHYPIQRSGEQGQLLRIIRDSGRRILVDVACLVALIRVLSSTSMIIKSLHILILTLLVSAVSAWATSEVGPPEFKVREGRETDRRSQAPRSHIQAKDGTGLQKLLERIRADNTGVSSGQSRLRSCPFVNGQVKATLNNQKGSYRINRRRMDFN